MKQWIHETRQIQEWNRSQKRNDERKHPDKAKQARAETYLSAQARDGAPARARVAELVSEGKSVRGCEEILRSEGFKHCDHVTVAKDLKLEYQRLSEATKATTVQHRQRVLVKLVMLEDRVRARGWDDPNYVGDLLSIIDRVIRLLGLSEERHRVEVAVGADVDPEKLVGYRKFVHETRWIPEAAFQPLWDVCRKLSQPPTAETTAAIGPPADSINFSRTCCSAVLTATRACPTC